MMFFRHRHGKQFGPPGLRGVRGRRSVQPAGAHRIHGTNVDPTERPATRPIDGLLCAEHRCGQHPDRTDSRPALSGTGRHTCWRELGQSIRNHRNGANRQPVPQHSTAVRRPDSAARPACHIQRAVSQPDARQLQLRGFGLARVDRALKNWQHPGTLARTPVRTKLQ